MPIEGSGTYRRNGGAGPRPACMIVLFDADVPGLGQYRELPTQVA